MTTYRQYLAEMAAPRNIDKDKIYWHGTTSVERAKSILAHGIIPYNIKVEGVDNHTSYTGVAIPVKDMVYLAKRPVDAAHHAMRKIAGTQLPVICLLSISGKSLKDIFPDEDDVGRFAIACYRAETQGGNDSWDSRPLLVGDRLKAWKYIRRKMGEKMYAEVFNDDVGFLDEVSAGNKIISILKKQENAGVNVDWFYYAVMDWGGRLAHKGEIMPTGAYKIPTTSAVTFDNAIKALEELGASDDSITEKDILKIKGIRKIA